MLEYSVSMSVLRTREETGGAALDLSGGGNHSMSIIRIFLSRFKRKKLVFPQKKEQVAYCPFFLLQAQGKIHLQLLHPVGALRRRVVDVLPHPSAHHRRADVAPRHPLPLPNQHLPGHCEVGKQWLGDNKGERGYLFKGNWRRQPETDVASIH